MKCKVKDCGRESVYKSQNVCQMHYFRFMRNGSYEKIIKRKYRIQNPAGYQKVYEPDHPLAEEKGYVYEHRFIYYNEIDKDINYCEMCGDKINWKSCHIDHIDEDVTNNKEENLRCLCRPCNTFRGHSPESMGKFILIIDGISKTASAWARSKGVLVSSATILRRKRNGMCDYDAVFSERKTHHNTKTAKYIAKYDKERGINIEN